MLLGQETHPICDRWAPRRRHWPGLPCVLVLRLPLRSAPMLERTALTRLLRAAGRRAGVIVIGHHRIGDATGRPGDPALFSATEDELDAQLRTIAASAQLIGPDDLEQAWDARGPHVLLTFDDGYADSRHAALPILEAHGARAAFFITTGFIDRPRLPWWDELTWIARQGGRPGSAAGWIAHYKLLPTDAAEQFVEVLAEQVGCGRPAASWAADEWCTWDDVRALQDAGMEIGAHTHDHPVLERATPARTRFEIGRSLDRLQAETGRRPRWFAYPVGGRDCFGPVARAELADHGVELAFSCYGGWNPGQPADRYDVRRLSASADEARLRAQVQAPAVFVGRTRGGGPASRR